MNVGFIFLSSFSTELFFLSSDKTDIFFSNLTVLTGTKVTFQAFSFACM